MQFRMRAHATKGVESPDNLIRAQAGQPRDGDAAGFCSFRCDSSCAATGFSVRKATSVVVFLPRPYLYALPVLPARETCNEAMPTNCMGG